MGSEARKQALAFAVSLAHFALAVWPVSVLIRQY